MITKKEILILLLVGGIGKNGLCTIKKTKKNEWEERLKTLENQISYWLNPENQTNKTVEIIQLFYDE